MGVKVFEKEEHPSDGVWVIIFLLFIKHLEVQLSLFLENLFVWTQQDIMIVTAESPKAVSRPKKPEEAEIGPGLEEGAHVGKRLGW